MVRVEEGQTSNELKKQITRQVEVDLRKQARRKKIVRFFGCLALLVVVVGGLLIGGAWLAARTGLYDVPLISSWAFKTPVPIHKVEGAENFQQIDLLENLESKIVNLMKTEYPGKLRVSAAEVSLEEEILTAYIRQNIDGIVENVSPSYKVSYVQLAAEPEDMEFFLRLDRDDNLPVYLSVLFVPVPKDSKIDLDIKNVRIGNLNIPTFIAKPLAGALFGSLIEMLKIPTVGFFYLKDIKLDYGELILIGGIEYTTF